MTLALLALGLLSYLALALPAETAGNRLSELPGSAIEFQEAGNPAAPLPQILSAATAFRPSSESTGAPRHVGSDPHVVWLRLTIPNDSPAALNAVLEFEDRELDLVECFLPQGDGSSSEAPFAKTGQQLPRQSRSVSSHLPAIDLTLPAGEATVVYARLVTDTHPLSGMTVWNSPEDFRRRESREALPLAFFFGLWFALLVAHAIGGAAAREDIYWLGLAWLAASAGALLFKTHFSAWLITSLPGATRHVAFVSLMMLAAYMLTQYSRGLLESGRHAPATDTLLAALSWILGIATLAAPTLLLNPAWTPVALEVANFVPLLTAVALLGAAAYLSFRGSRAAPLATLACACLSAGALWTLFGQLEVMPEAHDRGAALLIGLTLHAMILGLATVRREQRVREEKDQSQTLLLSRLKREVADRTGDLMSVSHQLTQSNEERERLTSILANDVRASLGSLVAASRSLPPEQAATQLMALSQQGNALIELLNNALDWSRLRSGKFPHRPAAVSLAAVVESALRRLEATAAEQSVRLERQVSSDLVIRADREAMECAVRNLARQAINVTTAGGTVRIEAAVRDGAAELRVQDAGAGLTAEQLAGLQSPTRPPSSSARGGGSESGDGIGLALARELIERDHGSLSFDSTLGRGTTAIATLPIAAARHHSREENGRHQPNPVASAETVQ